MPLLLAGALSALTTTAQAAQEAGTIDVIVVAESGDVALEAAVAGLGGVVRHRYDNVAALVASLPASRLAALRALPGVASAEKDGLVTLYGEPQRGRGRPMVKFDLAARGGWASAVDARSVEPRPGGYLNYLLTEAPATWPETGFGSGSVVAVVDSGTNPVEPCLAGGQVIGAPGFPNGFDAVGDNPANAPDNDPHGTWVGNVIAAACLLNLPPQDELAQAFLAHAPEVLVPNGPNYQLLLLGVAPFASIYPVKVFPKGAESTATSEILEGLDHLIGLKTTGALDVDVVNMSLGGGTLWDGRDAFDRFVDEVRRAGMVVVTSAGNVGPTPNTVGSPGTSFSAITAGATDEAVVSRVFYEWLGLAVWPGLPGQGLVMRPTDETRIVNFSSRGPISDGRMGPQIAALGTWNFVEGPDQSFYWVTGTSFSSPTVAGAAALLNAWWEAQGRETHPGKIRNALLLGADRHRVGREWRDVDDQGLGVLNVPDALAKLKQRHLPGAFAPLWAGRLQPNVLGDPRPWHRERYQSRMINLKPGETRDFVFEIDGSTSRVLIDLQGLDIPGNYDVAFFPNALQVDVQSAKRSALGRPIDTFLLDSFYADGSVTVAIEDGPWTFDGVPVADQTMEPGLMKLSLSGDFVNQSNVGFRARITRENYKDSLRRPVAKGRIENEDEVYVPVFVPLGTKKASFDLTWVRDWSRFPTSDLDLLLFSPGCLVPVPGAVCNVLEDGATLNAPERTVVDGPQPGLWLALVVGFEVNKKDAYKLFVNFQ